MSSVTAQGQGNLALGRQDFGFLTMSDRKSLRASLIILEINMTKQQLLQRNAIQYEQINRLNETIGHLTRDNAAKNDVINLQNDKINTLSASNDKLNTVLKLTITALYERIK